MIPRWFDYIIWDSLWKPPSHLRGDIPDVPPWDGSVQPGATMLVWNTFGHGDCFQFARYLKLAAARVGRIVVQFDFHLSRLARWLPGVSGVSPWFQGPLVPAPDFHCPLLALPMLLTQHDQIPPPALVDVALPEAPLSWLGRLETMPRPRIGVCWQGGKANPIDPQRSFPVLSFSRLVDAGMNLVAVQKGELITDFRIRSLGPDYQRGDWLDTAVTLRHLDLVIGPDTALPHLAGSLGVPTWLVVPTPCDWRWFPAKHDGQLDESRTPWYPAMRIFRQQVPGDWISPFRQMIDEFAREKNPGTGEKFSGPGV